jgi:hypothetical protein
MTGDIQARNDEAWSLGPGTPPTLTRMAELAHRITLIDEELAGSDWRFGQSAAAMRERLTTDRAGFLETLGELETGLRSDCADHAERPVLAAE